MQQKELERASCPNDPSFWEARESEGLSQGHRAHTQANGQPAPRPPGPVGGERSRCPGSRSFSGDSRRTRRGGGVPVAVTTTQRQGPGTSRGLLEAGLGGRSREEPPGGELGRGGQRRARRGRPGVTQSCCILRAHAGDAMRLRLHESRERATLIGGDEPRKRWPLGGWGGRGLSLGRSRRALAGTTRWPRPRPGGRCTGTRRRDGPPGCALRSRSRGGWKLCPEREAEPTEQAAWGGGGSPLPAGARRGCLAAPRGSSPGGGGAGRTAFGAPAATPSHGSYVPPVVSRGPWLLCRSLSPRSHQPHTHPLWLRATPPDASPAPCPVPPQTFPRSAGCPRPSLWPRMSRSTALHRPGEGRWFSALTPTAQASRPSQAAAPVPRAPQNPKPSLRPKGPMPCRVA